MPVVAGLPELAPTLVHEAPNVEVDSGPSAGLDYEPVPHPHSLIDINRLARTPAAVLQGLGNAAASVRNHYLGEHGELTHPNPERIAIRVGDYDRLVLHTAPDPEYFEANAEPVNAFAFPGLGEIDSGSHENLHKAIAASHPDWNVFSIMSLGMHISGEPLPFRDGAKQPISDTADNNRLLMQRFIGDEPSELYGTSLGSFTAMEVALGNLHSSPEDSLIINGVNLISPAVGAKNIPSHLDSLEHDANDKPLMHRTTGEFFVHMPPDVGRMVLRHPKQSAECAAMIGGYMLHPRKMPNRLATMFGHLTGVQQGMEWSDILDVAGSHDIRILGGEKDPLVQKALPQWIEARSHTTDSDHVIQIRVLGGLGHALTIDAKGTVRNLDEMRALSTEERHLRLAN